MVAMTVLRSITSMIMVLGVLAIVFDGCFGFLLFKQQAGRAALTPSPKTTPKKRQTVNET